jgi:TolB-like protein/Tfp pilus assembly protein PilF
MDGQAVAETWLFDGFRLDSGGLFRLDPAGGDAPVPLGSRALDLLRLLAGRQGQLVSKDAIMADVWPETVVDESNLTVQVSALRRVLDRQREQGSCIQTVPGRGYRFVATVTSTEARGAAPPLSIVVLPFGQPGNDPAEQDFADGLAADLAADLSRIAGLLVISSQTAFTYRDRRVGARQIGQELGVRYVLEGRVRRSGQQIRVNTQLIDAESDTHLWADRSVGEAGDLTEQQDEIVRRLAVSLGQELVRAEASRPAQRSDALAYYFRGRAAMLKPQSRDRYRETIDLFGRALALDPRSAEVQSMLAQELASRALDHLADSAGCARADTARADALVGHALNASPRSVSAHFAKAQVRRWQRRYEEAAAAYETVIALDRNSARAYAHLGRTKMLTGAIEETIPLTQQAIRLSPRDPVIGSWYYRVGLVHLLQSCIDDAVLWLEKARNAAPGLPYTHSHLAAAYALKGDVDRAAASLAEAKRLGIEGRYASIERLKRTHTISPALAAAYDATYFAGLRLAGMPEE